MSTPTTGKEQRPQMHHRAMEDRHDAVAVDRDLFGLLEEDAEGLCEADGGRSAEGGDRNGDAEQEHEGGDLGALDDIAVFLGLVEPSLCRLFRPLGIVAIVGHVSRSSPSAA